VRSSEPEAIKRVSGEN